MQVGHSAVQIKYGLDTTYRTVPLAYCIINRHQESDCTTSHICRDLPGIIVVVPFVFSVDQEARQDAAMCVMDSLEKYLTECKPAMHQTTTMPTMPAMPSNDSSALHAVRQLLDANTTIGHAVHVMTALALHLQHICDEGTISSSQLKIYLK